MAEWHRSRERKKQRWRGRYKDRQGNNRRRDTEGSDGDQRWQRQGDRVGEMTLEEARWAQEGTERREKAGSGGIKAREREQGGRGRREEVEGWRHTEAKVSPNVGTLKTNLRYSGNWGHWNLQRKQTKKTMGQEQSSGTLFWSPGSAVRH